MSRCHPLSYRHEHVLPPQSLPPSFLRVVRPTKSSQTHKFVVFPLYLTRKANFVQILQHMCAHLWEVYRVSVISVCDSIKVSINQTRIDFEKCFLSLSVRDKYTSRWLSSPPTRRMMSPESSASPPTLQSQECSPSLCISTHISINTIKRDESNKSLMILINKQLTFRESVLIITC